MRRIIVSYDDRPRPVVKTPAKGTLGDCTDETMAASTDLPSILARYGGNLAEIARWRGTMSYGIQPIDNLEDALDAISAAHDALADLPNNPFATLDDAFSAIKDGTFLEKITKKEVKDEKKPSKPEEVKANLPPDRVPPASEE